MAYGFSRKLLGSLAAAALLAVSPLALSDEGEVASPAALPTTLPTTAPIGVTVTVDTTQVPELADWGQKAKVYAEHWYPLIAQRLASDGFTPPHEVKLVFSTTYEGVAATSGTVVTISDKWVKAHPEDFGMVAHEITHVVQHYRRNQNAGWLVEGIADYVRYYYVEPGSPRARFNIKKSNWNNAYQPSAAFLDYLERTYPDKHVVSTLNTALRKGNYKQKMFEELTGKEPDLMWQEYKDSVEKK